VIEKKLFQLYEEHIGKVSDKWSCYLHEYEYALAGYRAGPTRVLEIGVQNGGSLEIWSKYFVGAELIVGCDVNPDCGQLVFDDDRISVVVGDANTDQTKAEIFQLSHEYQVVIDDGSHTSADIIKAFVNYFPSISDGGIFVVEDLHCGFWQGYDGGLYDPLSCVSFFKLMVDVTNYEHWGVDKSLAAHFSGFQEKYGVLLDDSFLEKVHSVEFSNSLCIVKKAPLSQNTLGGRFIAGNIEQVVSGHLDRLDSAQLVAPSQVNNYWSSNSFELVDSEAIEKKGFQIEELKKLVEWGKVEIERLNNLTMLLGDEVDMLKKLGIECERKITKLEASFSWRVTKPLRVIGSFLNIW
jgi:hypothetical protein